MKVLKFEDREAWLNARLGKITGSRLKDIYSVRGDRKIGSYQLVAESILGSAALAEEEDAMARGTRLEKDAIERYRNETGRNVDDSLILWVREDDERIAISPDGVVGKTGACEAKCLSAARHIEARITGRIPKDYEPQSREYFVVNDILKWLDFIFYDPRFPAGLDFFIIRINRTDVQDEIDALLAFQRTELAWVREQVNRLTLYSPDEITKAQQVREELLDEHRESVAKGAESINADPDELLGPAMPVKITKPKRGKAA